MDDGSQSPLCSYPCGLGLLLSFLPRWSLGTYLVVGEVVRGMQGNLGSMKDSTRKQKPVKGRASECMCVDKLRGRITQRLLGFRRVVNNFLCQPHLCLLYLARAKKTEVGGRAGTVHLISFLLAFFYLSPAPHFCSHLAMS